MKIVYVCNEYPPAPHGGVGTFVRMLAHAMKGRGHRVTVVGIGREQASWDDDGVRVEILRGSGNSRLSALANRWRLWRWLQAARQQFGVDIVEVPEFEGMLPLPLSGAVVRLHLSLTEILQQSGQRVPPMIRALEYWTLRSQTSWIGVSQYVLDRTRSTFCLTPRHATVILNPASLPDPASASRCPALPARFVLYAGAVSRRKGAYTVAEAARNFLVACPDVDLVFIGATSVEEGVDSGVRVLQIVGPALQHRVHLMGRLRHDQVAWCMRKAEVFVGTSFLEAFGLCAAEAMLAGLPCVLSDDPPFTEFARQEETALLVPPADVEGVAASVMRLLSDADLRSRLGQRAAQEMKSRFALEECARATEAFYAEMLAAGASAG
jgi:glycosyltransferase involved in cell wall biosynthesis